MSTAQIAGILILIAGILALTVGSFTYTKDRHDVDLGPLEFDVEERETVDIPMWAGIAAITVGLTLLVSARRGRWGSAS
jgi:hypothetical protein